jgi:hypothetical protein
MLYKLYLKKGTVYIPTAVNQARAVYMDVEPVTVFPVTDREALGRAMRDTDPQGKLLCPAICRRRPQAAGVAEYTGDKSWPAFDARHITMVDL